MVSAAIDFGPSRPANAAEQLRPADHWVRRSGNMLQ